MINGNKNDFINGLYYGDERFFLYRGKKYFVQGYLNDKQIPVLEVYELNCENGTHWIAYSHDNYSFPVEEFEEAKIFASKSFWEIEQEIEWVDD